jgi:rod shape determining protein RodA
MSWRDRLPTQMAELGMFRWTGLLMFFGLTILISAAQQYGTDVVYRQGTWMCVGLAAAVMCMKIGYRYWLDASVVLYLSGLIVLVFVLVAGHASHGAARWLTIGPISVQPSEFMKIITALFLARVLGDALVTAEHPSVDTTLKVLLYGAVPTLLVFLQPDLGTALTFIWITIVVLWIGNTSGRLLGMLAGAGLLLLPVGLSLLKEYQRSRILVFLNPDLDPLGAGYTIIQSRIAIGSGGLLGKGWMSGTQSQLHFLPERHTDFIFSVVGEEWGFVGCAVLLLLFGLWLADAWSVVARTEDVRGRLLAAGMAGLVGFHVVVNVGMTMGLLPVVGLPLPLISSGGSVVLTMLIASGLIESVRRSSVL